MTVGSALLFLRPQISGLSDLADRPLVGALTSRLQALHVQLQSFVEKVDSLGKTPASGREPQGEGESTLCSGDSQDAQNEAEEKVKDHKHSFFSLLVTPFFHLLFFF